MRGWGAFGARIRGADPRRQDLGLTLLVQLAVTMPFVVPRSADAPPADWASYAMTTLGVLPLVWRRRAPVTVLVAILAAGGVYKLTVDGPGQPLPYAGLIAFYRVALQCSARVRLAVGALALPLSVSWKTGTAREMHDILSHAVSIMIVQAEAGPVAVRRAPERAEAAFEAIAETGRDAMAQLRTMLGVLRTDGAPPRRPQPHGYNTAIGGTRDLSRTLVYSVNSTDAKGQDMNPVALGIVGAASSQ